MDTLAELLLLDANWCNSGWGTLTCWTPIGV